MSFDQNYNDCVRHISLVPIHPYYQVRMKKKQVEKVWIHFSALSGNPSQFHHLWLGKETSPIRTLTKKYSPSFIHQKSQQLKFPMLLNLLGCFPWLKVVIIFPRIRCNMDISSFRETWIILTISVWMCHINVNTQRILTIFTLSMSPEVSKG